MAKLKNLLPNPSCPCFGPLSSHVSLDHAGLTPPAGGTNVLDRMSGSIGGAIVGTVVISPCCLTWCWPCRILFGSCIRSWWAS